MIQETYGFLQIMISVVGLSSAKAVSINSHGYRRDPMIKPVNLILDTQKVIILQHLS
jgi:hypothetical protein